MAHQNDGDGLPATWPFRAAATLLIAALVWFCLGAGLHDVGEELPAYMPIFYYTLLVGLLLVIGGAIFNLTRRRSPAAQK